MSGNKNSDPTDELKKLLSDVETNGVSNNVQSNDDADEEAENPQVIDVLNLPPRKEVHSGRTKHMRIKVTKPYVRLIIVVLLIIILFAGGFYVWGDDLIKIIQHI